METLKRKRGSVKGKNTKVYNLVFNKLGNLKKEEINIYLEQIRKIEQELEEVNEEMIQIIEQDEEAENEKEYNKIQTRIE